MNKPSVPAIRLTLQQLRELELDFRAAITPLINMKVYIVARSKFSLIRYVDGRLSESVYPPETVSALAEIDGYISEIADYYKRLAV